MFVKLAKSFGLFLVSMLASSPVVTAQDGPKVGQLSDLSATVQQFPISPPNLKVTGKIMAPTPCYTAQAAAVGDVDESSAPLKIEVTLTMKSNEVCAEVLAHIDFRYDRPLYRGGHQQLEVFSDVDSRTVGIVDQ